MMAATSIAELEQGAATPIPARGRIGNVDILRAVAALAVLVIHAYALGGRVAPIKAQHWYDVPLITLASGVWLFFGISGYVISRPFVERLIGGRPLPRWGPYALRRGLRIFPLYWVALSLLIAIDGAAGTRAWQLPFHYLLLNNLIPGRQEALFPSAWTLTLEVLFYVALPVLALAVRSRWRSISAERLAGLVIISWIASIVFTTFADLQGDGEIGLWLRGSLPAMWQMFCPGILLAIVPHLPWSRGHRWAVAAQRGRLAIGIAIAALVPAAILSSAAPLDYGVVAYQLLVDASRPLFAVGYGLIIAAAIRGRPWGARARWPLELGLISYGIYLLHPLVIDLLLRVHGSPLRQNDLLGFLVNAACVTALIVPLSLVSWRYFEREFIRLGRRDDDS